MTSYISKRGYVVRKDTLSANEIHDIKKELRGRPLQDAQYTFSNTPDSSYPLYMETTNKLYIPKMYGIAKFGDAKELPNYTGSPWTSDLDFQGNLLPHQVDPVNVLLAEMLNGSGGGILSLATGLGKTVSAIKVLSMLKRKTIIVVNKISLMKQWESEIKTFLPNAKIGFIQGQKNVSIADKDIVIAMLQSLARIDYPDAYFDDISVTCIDEVHNISSKVFSRVLMKLCSKYTIGLSATPNRSDGCEYVFKWFIGDIIYKSSSSRKGLPPIINTVRVSSKDYIEVSTRNAFTGKDQIQFTSMLSQLIAMPKRNKVIMEIILHMTSLGRKLLVLSDRREHLKSLLCLLEQNDCVTFTYGLFVGGMKIGDLQKSKACDVILATYQAFGEGVNEKDLDTLLLITPKKFIGHLKNTTKNESGKLEQIVGRIFRKEHTQHNPMIVDIHDNFSVYKNQFSQRKMFYKQHFKDPLWKEQKIDLDKFDNLASIKYKSIETTKETPMQSLDQLQELTNYCMLD
jgi:superfamily II DNA or RNA helicase